MKQKYAIFGAGDWGRAAIKEYGKANIAYVIDNNNSLQGKEIEGIPIVGLEHYIQDECPPHLLIAVKNCESICEQLEQQGLYNYSLCAPQTVFYYPPDVLVCNPYEYKAEYSSEADFEAEIDKKQIRWVERRVKKFKDEIPLFRTIEIETYNRCNGVCEFCPVSVQNESRPEMKMGSELFKKIIDNLAALDYHGRLALFSNNEPFLDPRILELHKYAREKLPNAMMHLYTNGTLLTIDKFLEIMKYLDQLIIDNYNQELKLIPNCREIKEYCETHRELIKRVTIVLRKPQEILTTRGGDAPNRKEKISYADTQCVNPFVQMIVRPDGKVSLCCNDPLGRDTMGDLSQQTLQEVWYGEPFQKVRAALRKGRQYWPHCEFCDTFNIG